jgi:hypothetical protein
VTDNKKNQSRVDHYAVMYTQDLINSREFMGLDSQNRLAVIYAVAAPFPERNPIGLFRVCWPNLMKFIGASRRDEAEDVLLSVVAAFEHRGWDYDAAEEALWVPWPTIQWNLPDNESIVTAHARGMSRCPCGSRLFDEAIEAWVQALGPAGSKFRLHAEAARRGERVNDSAPQPRATTSPATAMQPSGLKLSTERRKVQAPTTRGSTAPIFKGKRLRVLPWMLDELKRMLGPFADDFDLRAWFITADQLATNEQGIIEDWWPWLKEKLFDEVRYRGLPDASDTISARAVPVPIPRRR